MPGSIAHTILVDSNLLWILVVGSADPTQIGRARRTEAYTADSFVLLRAYIERYQSIVITPNLLTEISNLADMLAWGPLRDEVIRLIATLPEVHQETYVRSLEAVKQMPYPWLGLTDATILIAGTLAAEVLTTDGPLCEALWRAGIRATNFTHIRQQYGDL